MSSRILIVEDSPTAALELRFLLEEHGYEVTAAAEGRQGLAAARAYRPDLIISDILLPGMDGYEMCYALKQDDSLRGIPVILVTVLSDSRDIVRGLKAGADYYLTKPYDEDLLLTRVRTALSSPALVQHRDEEEPLEIVFAGERAVITSGRRQILTLLLSTYENAVQQNRELAQAQSRLQRLNEQLEKRVEERTAALRAEVRERRRAEETLKDYSERLEEMVEERTRELREAQEELVRREKLAVLGQLAGGVAHELRNPLGAIKNAAWFLKMVVDDPDPQVQESLEILERQVVRSAGIIDSLLDFAHRRAPLSCRMDVNQVLQEALSELDVPKNVEVVRQFDDSLPTITADPDQLRMVFANIILNGVQAMTLPEPVGTSGGGVLTLSTSWDDDEVEEGRPPDAEPGWSGLVERGTPSPWLRVSISDAGVGIREEDLEKVFEPLFSTKTEGIGLGLSLAKAIVEQHGGGIEVQSEVGEGSSFTIWLPVERVA